MDWVLALAMVLGIGPALAFMYIVVRDYTYPKVEQPFFSDPTFFMLFVVGMVAGAVLVVVTWMMGLLSNVILMILVGLLEVMVTVVVMNLRRFRGKSDSVFYGYGLGLGMSSGYSTGLCFMSLGVVDSYDVASIAFLLVVSVSMTFTLGAAGTTVGEGIARHRVMEFALQSMIPVIVYNMLLYAVISVGGGALYYVILAVMMVISAIYFYRVMYIRLPQIIREVLKMEGRKRDDLPR